MPNDQEGLSTGPTTPQGEAQSQQGIPSSQGVQPSDMGSLTDLKRDWQPNLEPVNSDPMGSVNNLPPANSEPAPITGFSETPPITNTNPITGLADTSTGARPPQAGMPPVLEELPQGTEEVMTTLRGTGGRREVRVKLEEQFIARSFKLVEQHNASRPEESSKINLPPELIRGITPTTLSSLDTLLEIIYRDLGGPIYIK